MDNILCLLNNTNYIAGIYILAFFYYGLKIPLFIPRQGRDNNTPCYKIPLPSVNLIQWPLNTVKYCGKEPRTQFCNKRLASTYNILANGKAYCIFIDLHCCCIAL